MDSIMARRYLIDLNEKEPKWYSEGIVWEVTPTQIKHTEGMTDYVFPDDGEIYDDLKETGVHIGELNAVNRVMKLEIIR